MHPFAFFLIAVFAFGGALIAGVTTGIVMSLPAATTITTPTPTSVPTATPTEAPTPSPTPCWQFPVGEEEGVPLDLPEGFLDTDGSAYEVAVGNSPYYFGFPDTEMVSGGAPYCDTEAMSSENPYIQVTVPASESQTYYYCITSFHLGGGDQPDTISLTTDTWPTIISGNGVPAVNVPFCVPFVYSGEVLNLAFHQVVGNGDDALGVVGFISTVSCEEKEGWTKLDPAEGPAGGYFPTNATVVIPH